MSVDEEELDELRHRIELIEDYLLINARDELEKKVTERIKGVYNRAVSDDIRELGEAYKDGDLSKTEEGNYMFDGEDLGSFGGVKLDRDLSRLGFEDLDEAVSMSQEQRNRRIEEKLSDWKENTDVSAIDEVKEKIEGSIEDRAFILPETDDLSKLMERYNEIMEELDSIEERI